MRKPHDLYELLMIARNKLPVRFTQHGSDYLRLEHGAHLAPHPQQEGLLRMEWTGRGCGPESVYHFDFEGVMDIPEDKLRLTTTVRSIVQLIEGPEIVEDRVEEYEEL